MKNNIKWICIFTFLCLICVVFLRVVPNVSDGKCVAQIKQGDTVIRNIDLSKVSGSYEFEIKGTDGGSNKIRVEKGRIAVIEADCPDKICVKQGYIQNGSIPIVCLPHRLSVTIIGKDGIDAVTGGVDAGF